MVVVLFHQFRQLLPAILQIAGNVAPVCRCIRNFGPCNQAVFVAQPVHDIRLLVVGKPDTVCTDLPDHLEVFSVFLVTQRRSHASPFLVTANSIQRIRFSI